MTVKTTTSVQIDKEKRSIRAGDFEFFLVQDGYYRLDGGAMYGMVPKTIWEKIENYDENNRLYMCMNCLVAKRGDSVYLADVGIGDKLDEKGRKIFGIEKDKTLIEELADIGITPDMVTHVIPTHLHFDHSGWIVDNEGKITFPNAQYYIQKTEWEEAFNPHVRFKASYLKPYYEALVDTPNLVIIDGDAEIDIDVWVYFTPGHSRGHQIAMFDAGAAKVAHFGDVAALASQIRQNWTCGFDREPETTITSKQRFLERAFEENWYVMTAHDRTIRIGQIEQVKGKYRLRKVL